MPSDIIFVASLFIVHCALLLLQNVRIKVEFAGLESSTSPVLHTHLRNHIPINFSSRKKSVTYSLSMLLLLYDTYLCIDASFVSHLFSFFSLYVCVHYFSRIDIFADTTLQALIKKEIKSQHEYLSLSIHLIDDNTSETIAMASVNLWVMIEDSCNLPLQVGICLCVCVCLRVCVCMYVCCVLRAVPITCIVIE